MSELSPAKLALFPPSISTFVQTSCPRLSIDWGMAFQRPVLTPYEAALAVGRVKVKEETKKAGWEAGFKDDGETYPMDFYAVRIFLLCACFVSRLAVADGLPLLGMQDDSLGPWTPRHGLGRPKRAVVATAP